MNSTTTPPEMTDRYGGRPPNVATLCSECDGFGTSPEWTEGAIGDVTWSPCEACGGTGKRKGMHPLVMALRETADGFAKPVAFAWLMLRKYGPREGRVGAALRGTWREERHNRWALARYVREAARLH